MGGGRGGGVWGDGRRRKEKGKLLSKETRWALEKVNEFLPPLRRSLSLLSLPLSSCLVLQPIFRKPSTSLCPARSLSPRPSRFLPHSFSFSFHSFFPTLSTSRPPKSRPPTSRPRHRPSPKNLSTPPPRANSAHSLSSLYLARCWSPKTTSWPSPTATSAIGSRATPSR